MTGDDLIAEGQLLARPCVHLKARGEPDRLAAVWGGPGIVPVDSETEELRHWISFNARFLPEGFDLSGCFSLYYDDYEMTAIVIHDPNAKLIVHMDHLPLFAHPAISIPPIDALFKLGSNTLKTWLTGLGWDASWGYNGNFDDLGGEQAKTYIRADHDQRDSGVAAMLGGWAWPWPDDETSYIDPDKQLLLWTFRDAEPWIEVWREAGKFEAVARIT